MQQKIRPVALAIIRRNDRYLFDQMTDKHRNLSFLRPLGGSIEFGETSHNAIIREIREEIDAEVLSASLLANFENIFVYNNSPMHEIVYLYNVRLKDSSIYNADEVIVNENTSKRIAKWIDYNDLAKHTIYPRQVIDFI